MVRRPAAVHQVVLAVVLQAARLVVQVAHRQARHHPVRLQAALLLRRVVLAVEPVWV